MLVENKEIKITGRFVRMARIKEEWYEDVKNPESIIKKLKDKRPKADIFTFWQRLPETKPKYNYYMEWDSVAALPIKTFDHWWKKQINAKTRNLIRKAQKKGVHINMSEFSDEFIKGMTNIFNEAPIRQGRPFWHYGKDFETVKREFSKYLYREELIGAYYKDDLIGFIMLAHAGRYAMTSQIISKIEHRDKSPTNALLAKAVEICENKRIPYLVYAKWPRGSLADFKRHNGFKKIDTPRYYIPLNVKGTIAIKFHLHHGIAGILPEKSKDYLKYLKNNIYLRKSTKII